jgi:hypothetical protein
LERALEVTKARTRLEQTLLQRQIEATEQEGCLVVNGGLEMPNYGGIKVLKSKIPASFFS